MAVTVKVFVCPSYMMMLVFGTDCYNFLHFNLFYINFTRGSKTIALLFLM